MFDVNNFIAEVGGYLGLLRGASVYSIYYLVQVFVSNFNASEAKKKMKGVWHC